MVFPPGFQQQMLVVLVHLFMHFSFVRIIVDVHFRIMMWQFITRGYSGVCACFLESVCYRVKEIRVCALACLRALTSFSLFLNVWSAAA